MTSIYNIIYKILTLTVHILKALVLCLCLFLSSVKHMLSYDFFCFHLSIAMIKLQIYRTLYHLPCNIHYY